jgi:hypothetical protein
MRDNIYFRNNILPCLTIHTDGKLQLMPRAHIINLVKVFKSAIVIQHQVNNEYNYSFLEFQHLGFPLIHNVPRFQKHGYYYPENDFEKAALQIEYVVKNHSVQKELRKSQIQQLMWDFSIYNPENLATWKKLVLEK